MLKKLAGHAGNFAALSRFVEKFVTDTGIVLLAGEGK